MFDNSLIKWCWVAIMAVQATFLVGQGSMSDVDSVKNSVLMPLVVTGQFLPTDVQKTVNTVRVINAQTISARGAGNLEELLFTEPNVRITQDAILGSSISINGLRGENLKVLIDGVPVVGRLNGSVDAGQLPLSQVRQVEIIEGAQSLLYGSDASAGVINLVSRTSQYRKLTGEVRSIYESNGYRTYNVHTGIKMKDFLLQASGGQMFFRPEDDTPQRGQTWNPRDQTTGRLSLGYKKDDNFQMAVTGSIFEERTTSLDSLKRLQFRPYALDDFFYTQRKDLSVNASGWLDNKYYWMATAAGNFYTRQKNSFRYDADSDTSALITGEQDTSRADGYLLRATLASNYIGKKVDFLVGLDNYLERSHGIRIIDTTLARHGFASNNEVGIFGSLQIKPIVNMTIQPGARLIMNQTYGSRVTPALWMMWRPVNTLTIRTSYASGFRSPGLKELYYEFVDANHNIHGNIQLKPERSNNFKLEVTAQPAWWKEWRPTITATAFYNNIKDQISLIATDIATVEFQYHNIDRWQTKGAGLSFGIAHKNMFHLRTNYLYTGYFNSLTNFVEHLREYNYSGDWTNEIQIKGFKERVTFNIWHKFTGATPYFYVNGNKISESTTIGYHMANASVGALFWNKNVMITAGVKNILDVRNAEVIGSAEVGHSTVGLRPVHWGRSVFGQVLINLKSKS